MPVYEFHLIARFRNKREDTRPRAGALAREGAGDAEAGHGDLGVLTALFRREAPSPEEAVREAMQQFVAAFPDAVIHEIHAPSVGRMEVRRAMQAVVVPWRFLDQGEGDMGLCMELKRRVGAPASNQPGAGPRRRKA